MSVRDNRTVLKLDSLQTFVAAAEAGSISEAARRLQISKSVASERLADLERNIGGTLIRRSTRKLTLTEDGVAFLERAKRILREVSEASAEISERDGALVGPLRISVPVGFGILHLSAALNSFIKRNPRIELSLDLNDRFVGATDGFDAIIRHGPLPNKTWVTKRIAPSRRILVASPDYLRANGTPATVAELGQHRGIIYAPRGASDWRFRQAGRWTVVRPRAVMRVNNGIMMRDAAVAGLGIALLASFYFQAPPTFGKLSIVDVGAEAEAATVFIGYPADRRISKKVLALIAHLREVFGTPPYWERLGSANQP
jgi:DNA-binding transcriptional LysR family regulator